MRASARIATLTVLIASGAWAMPRDPAEIEHRCKERAWDLWCQGVPLEERTEEVAALRIELTPVPAPLPALPPPTTIPMQDRIERVEQALRDRGMAPERIRARLKVLRGMLEHDRERTLVLLEDEIGRWRALPGDRKYDLGDITVLSVLCHGITSFPDFYATATAQRPIEEKISTLLTPEVLVHHALSLPEGNAPQFQSIQERSESCPLWTLLRNATVHQTEQAIARLRTAKQELERIPERRRTGVQRARLANHRRALERFDASLLLRHAQTCPFCHE